MNKNFISESILSDSYNYESYRKLCEDLVAADKTTGPNQSPALVEYSRLNIQRMNRVEKTVKLNEEMLAAIHTIQEEWIWLVMAEAWCGDVPANLPVIAKMAETSPNITLHILLRDENAVIMDQMLTNGGRSIPKLACLRASDLSLIGQWGPRPAPAQKMVMDYKANPIEPYMEMVKRVQLWYAKDRGKTIQEEFGSLIKEWNG